jgi:hypothetical protein
MPAVERRVAQVVGEVPGARDGAERDERDHRVHDLRALVKLLREQEPGEDEQVLDPLRWPHRHDEGEGRGPPADPGLSPLGPGRDGAPLLLGERLHRQEG